MGGGSFSLNSYHAYSRSVEGKSRSEVFSQRTVHKDLNPKGVTVRESRDSDEHPESNAIIIGLDVTGSMGMIAHRIAEHGLGKLMNGLLETQPVRDPQIMFMGIGDFKTDQAPLQVSQFESDNRIVDQLSKLWLEGGGGGNSHESYDGPHYFAANHTSIDCFEKRGKRGYLFTMGDENPPHVITRPDANRVMGYTPEVDLKSYESLLAAQRMYHVFHLVIAQGSFCRMRGTDGVLGAWREVLGSRALLVTDYEYIPEIITSAIRVSEGEDPELVIHELPDETAKRVVRVALFD